MRALTRLVATCASLVVAAAPALAQTQPQPPQQPQIQRPSIVAPLQSATTPVLFQWTAVAPGSYYTLVAQGNRRAPQATTLGAASYELQISDRPDVDSNVLIDTITATPTYLFLNRYPDQGFTLRQRTPLPGGRYYFRVRALFGQYASQYSTITRFTLVGGPGSTTPLHELGLFALGAAGTLSVGNASSLYAVVANVGTYGENAGSLAISVNGETIGALQLPPLQPGQRATITVPYVPTNPGQTQIVARLTFADENPENKYLVATAGVGSRRTLAGTLAGTIRVAPDGSYFIEDAKKRRLAAVVPSAALRTDLATFRDAPVLLSGRMLAWDSGFRYEADAAVRSTAAVPVVVADPVPAMRRP